MTDSPANIKAVLFDLDGTLLDTHDLILGSFRHATWEVLGERIADEDLLKKVGQPLDTQMWDFAANAEEHDRLLTTYREHNHVIHDEMVRAFDGVAEMLSTLKDRGLRTAVVTSKRHALAQRGIDVCDLSNFIEFVVGPDDFPAHKPDPGPVLYACELMGFAPEECMYAGDSPYDIQAGNGAGCVTVACMWGMFAPELLDEQNPAFTIKRPEELIALIG